MLTQTRTKIIVFAKAPIPGHAKTRLTPALGAVGAANLHKRLVRQTLINVCDTKSTEVQLHYSEPHPFIWRLARHFKIALLPQKQGNLGSKMLHSFKQTKGPALLMGSDCPCISSALLDKCIALLTTHDAVILPAEDGGYGLIGIKNTNMEGMDLLFKGVSWGTNSVMEETRKKLKELNVQWAEPETVWDVDRPEDLARLNIRIKKGGKKLPPKHFGGVNRFRT